MKTTYDSSGDAAIEQRPPGIAPPAVQLTPPSVERKCPSSPQTSTIPPVCATTSHTSVAAVAGVGSTNVQVAPPSVVRATPQLVPTNAVSGASGWMLMPNAAGSLRRGRGAVVRGWRRGAWPVASRSRPPSPLTDMPARVSTRPSYQDVAYTTLLLPGRTATSQVTTGRWPLRRAHEAPPLVDLNRPPYSLAA